MHLLRRSSLVWLGVFAYDLLLPWVTEKRVVGCQYLPSLQPAGPWLLQLPAIVAVATCSCPYSRSDAALDSRSSLPGAVRFWTVMPLGVEALALQLRRGPEPPS